MYYTSEVKETEHLSNTWFAQAKSGTFFCQVLHMVVREIFTILEGWFFFSIVLVYCVGGNLCFKWLFFSTQLWQDVRNEEKDKIKHHLSVTKVLPLCIGTKLHFQAVKLTYYCNQQGPLPDKTYLGTYRTYFKHKNSFILQNNFAFLISHSLLIKHASSVVYAWGETNRVATCGSQNRFRRLASYSSFIGLKRQKICRGGCLVGHQSSSIPTLPKKFLPPLLI